MELSLRALERRLQHVALERRERVADPQQGLVPGEPLAGHARVVLVRRLSELTFEDQGPTVVAGAEATMDALRLGRIAIVVTAESGRTLAQDVAFDAVEALKRQMAKDCEDARETLANVPLETYL